jgi:diguanylate cyclase (GGDEF)-like protein/PAS domain S-box-containing protein
MENELKTSLSLINATIESTVNGIIVIDNEGMVISYNKKFKDMLKVSDDIIHLISEEIMYNFLRKKIINYENIMKAKEKIRENPSIEITFNVEDYEGSVYEIYSKPQKVEETIIGRVWSFYDITDQKKNEEKLIKMAHYDSLTGIPNRTLFFDRLNQAYENANRYHTRFALLFLDLDGFKYINDSLGHAAGDMLLRDISDRLKSCIRKSDTVARMGGDEFTIILSQIVKNEDCAYVAQKLIDSLSKTIMISGHECSVGVSIGISVFPDDSEKVEQFLKNADTAMYHAKEGGKNCFQFYLPSMNESVVDRLRIETDMKKAILRNEFILYYQPQVDINTGKIIGIEALIRWNHPERGMVPPMHFIPVAEETGLIVDIGYWVLRRACLDTVMLHKRGHNFIRVAVNLSGAQFRKKICWKW